MSLIRDYNREDEAECFQEFKNRIEAELESYPLLRKLKDEEEILRVFLIGRKFQVDYAFETLKNYLNARYVTYAQIYEIKMSSVRHILESGFVGMLKSPDRLGRVVVVGRASKLDPSVMPWELLIKAVAGAIECLWEDSEKLRRGQLILADFTGYSMALSRSYTLSQKIQSINLFFRNYPIQIKGFMGVNNPKYAEIALAIIKPFLNKKIKNRINLYGNNLEALHEFVAPEVLPIWLGGMLADEDAFDMDSYQKVLNIVENSDEL